NAAVADSGAYTLLASNVVGLSTSVVATVTVTASPPVFVQQPVSLAALAGTSATFSSLATGSNPLRYQWYFQNNPLPNQTNNQLTLNPATLASAGQYFVVASNVFAMRTSTIVSLTVTTAPPVFTLQPASGSALAGGVATLTARVSG